HSPDGRASLTGGLAAFAREPHVTSVASPYHAPGQISRDGHVAVGTIEFGVPSTGISNGEALALTRDARAASGQGVTFSLGGDVVDMAETPYSGPGEGIGVIAAAAVLLIAFGSLLAMGLPVVTPPPGLGGGLLGVPRPGPLRPAPAGVPAH